MPMLEVRRLKTVRAVRFLPVLRLGEGVLNRLPRVLVKQRQKVTISRLPEWEFKDTLEAEMRRTAAEIDEAQLKWLILMVLFRQPGQEDACAAIEDLLFDDFGAWLH